MFDSVLPPSYSWRWRHRRYRWLVDTFISVELLTGRGWYGSGRPGPLLNLFRNLPKSRYLISYIAIWWINLKVPEGSMITSENNSVTRESSYMIVLKSRLNSTGHSSYTSEVHEYPFIAITPKFTLTWNQIYQLNSYVCKLFILYLNTWYHVIIHKILNYTENVNIKLFWKYCLILK